MREVSTEKLINLPSSFNTTQLLIDRLNPAEGHPCSASNEVLTGMTCPPVTLSLPFARSPSF